MGLAFFYLYSKQNAVTDAALKHMENLTTKDDLDTEQTIIELSKAKTEMSSWKAPDSDGIPTGLLCQCKSCLLPLLHDTFVKC